LKRSIGISSITIALGKTGHLVRNG
jgi:hypothetical protein